MQKDQKQNKHKQTSLAELHYLQKETEHIPTQDKLFVEEVVKRTIAEYQPVFRQLAKE